MTAHNKARVAFYLRQAATLRSLCLRLSKAGISGAKTAVCEMPGSIRIAERAPSDETPYKDASLRSPQ